MSRRQKLAVGAVLGLIVLLYTGAVGNGARSGSGDAAHPGGVVGWLGGLVGHPPAAARSDLSAPCLTDRTLSVQGSCTLSVAKSSGGTRQVKLHATDPVRVESRAPDSRQTVTDDVKAGDDVSVTVDGTGGDIAISCPAADTCTATLP